MISYAKVSFEGKPSTYKFMSCDCNITTSADNITEIRGHAVARKTVHQSSPNPVNLPNCDFLSSVFEPLNFFKHAEFKYEIRVNVEIHHPKDLS